jgi:GAF domain-containing protein
LRQPFPVNNVSVLRAPIPDDEDAQMAALERTRLLDTFPDETFEGVTRCVAHAVHAPVALISLVDSDRQGFLSKVGITACETPRDISFCGHMVAMKEPLIVHNVFGDARFFDNPLVRFDPNIRAYLGAPILTAQHAALGTVCAIDVEPHQWTDEDVVFLADMARIVSEMIDDRTARLDLADLLTQHAQRRAD